MSLDKKYFTGVVWQDFQHKELMDHFHIFGDDKKLGDHILEAEKP